MSKFSGLTHSVLPTHSVNHRIISWALGHTVGDLGDPGLLRPSVLSAGVWRFSNYPAGVLGTHGGCAPTSHFQPTFTRNKLLSLVSLCCLLCSLSWFRTWAEKGFSEPRDFLLLCCLNSKRADNISQSFTHFSPSTSSSDSTH